MASSAPKSRPRFIYTDLAGPSWLRPTRAVSSPPTRVNIYLPAELSARKARAEAAGLDINLSALVQEVLAATLDQLGIT